MLLARLLMHDNGHAACVLSWLVVTSDSPFVSAQHFFKRSLFDLEGLARDGY